MAVQRGLQLDRRSHIRSPQIGEEEPVVLIEKNFEKSGRHVAACEIRPRNAGVRTINDLISLAPLRYAYRVLSGVIAEMARLQVRNQRLPDVIGVKRDDAIRSRAEHRHNFLISATADR